MAAPAGTAQTPDTPGTWSLPARSALADEAIRTALLWLLAVVVSSGYLPGSESEAFKGISVFIGLMISLGSTGIMNQIMSGLTITYSLALPPARRRRLAR